MPLFQRRELKTLSLPPSLEPKCGHCLMFKESKHPKVGYSGGGRQKVLVVTETPGRDDELVAPLRKAGLDLKKDCWLEYALSCSPPGGKFPHDHAVPDCRPHLIKTVTELNPEVVILLGAKAVEGVIGWLWKEDVGPVPRWAGYAIPHRGLNAWVVPTYHPSYLGYEKSPVLDRQFAGHLKFAAGLKGRPYKSHIQPAEDFCDIVLDDAKAAEGIRNVHAAAAEHGTPVAFDYETTTLKPHGPHAEIYVCSVAFTEYAVGSDYAFCFLWRGEAVRAMKKLLADPRVKKVGSNIKFEHEWTAWHLGIDVKGWRRCTMLASHGLENGSKTRRITSIKFQAFAHLGVDEWDSELKEYLKSPGGNTPNRVKQAPLRDLMIYCALDSLYELWVAREQTKLIGGEK